ncbi:MAG: disulfide bond formation protein B [Burkholderiaceae bacterium]|jgi:disulfide bond formation protein DsbB
MGKLRFSQRPTSYRLWYAALLLMCVAPLAAAEYLQRWLDIAPCPLCVMQRYGFWVMGLFALFGLLLGRLPRWADFLAALSGLAGAAVAAYHVSILMRPSAQCGVDPVENFVNRLPMAQWWPEMFAASGFCNAKLPLIFGLSFPVWGLITLSVTTFLWFVLWFRRR